MSSERKLKPTASLCLFKRFINAAIAVIENNILFFFMIPLFIIACLGSFKKRDIRIIPYLFAVIPIQVIAYGIGFFQAFIRRFVFQESEIIGFSKRYYK